jgi:anti-sigma factor RsiW
MNDRDMCGNENALIAFLYDEGDPAEREATRAHVAHCASCAMEIEALRLTRTHLAAWTPPAAALGFRVTRDEEAPGTAAVLTSPRWWTRPLPAWAQAAAAIVIFAGGMALGTSRASTNASAGVVPSTPAVATAAAVSREDFDALRAEVMALRTLPPEQVRVATAVDGGAVLSRVSTFVDQQVSASEARQRREWDRRIAELVTDFQAVRYADLERVSNTVNGYQAATGQRLMEHSNAISQWNQFVGAGQVVPTSLVR